MRVVKFFKTIFKGISDSYNGIVRCRNCESIIPSHWAWTYYGAVFQGGRCLSCGMLHQGKFLGNLSGMKFLDKDSKVLLPAKNSFSLIHFEEKGWKLQNVFGGDE